MFHTNISIDEILGLVKYIEKQPEIISLGYTTECSNKARKYSYPACFLYAPDKNLFGGASVMIPAGGNPSQVNFYDYTRNFAFFATHNQDFFLEKAPVIIHNAIDKKYAKSLKMKNDGYATRLAVKLKKFGFLITGVQNAEITGQETVAYILGSGKISDTLQTLKTFITIDRIQQYTGIKTYTGAEILLVLGNNYLQTIYGTPFNYYK